MYVLHSQCCLSFQTACIIAMVFAAPICLLLSAGITSTSVQNGTSVVQQDLVQLNKWVSHANKVCTAFGWS